MIFDSSLHFYLHSTPTFLRLRNRQRKLKHNHSAPDDVLGRARPPASQGGTQTDRADRGCAVIWTGLMAPPAALKAKPNSRRIWTPNHSTGGIRARRFPFAPNISAPYTPPARLPAPQKTLTELDPESIAELRERITIWDEEADRLEFGTSNGPPPTIDEQLAQLLCKDNLPSECCQKQNHCQQHTVAPCPASLTDVSSARFGR
jgi:hypothetical protein